MGVKPAAQGGQAQTATRYRVESLMPRPRDPYDGNTQVTGGSIDDSRRSYAVHRVFASNAIRGGDRIPPESQATRVACRYSWGNPTNHETLRLTPD